MRVTSFPMKSAGPEGAMSDTDGGREGSGAESGRRLFTALFCAGMGAILISLAAGYVKYVRLAELREHAEQKRSQLVNVKERREAVVARYGIRPDRDGRAELDGAENRVRVERRRYDLSAGEYNEASSTPLGAVLLYLFDLPSRIPLSREINRW